MTEGAVRGIGDRWGKAGEGSGVKVFCVCYLKKTNII